MSWGNDGSLRVQTVFFQYAHRIVRMSLWIISTGLYLSFNLHYKFLLGDNYPVTYQFPHIKYEMSS